MSPLLGSAFAAAERLGGAPVHLYTFARGDVMWRYTSDGLGLTVAATSIAYVAAKIDHDEIQRKDESGAVDIKLTLATRLAVIDALRDGSTEPMYLAIHKYHPSAGGMPARFAYGAVGSASLDSATGTCELVLHTSEGDFDVDVPRMLITVQCQKATYSAECGVRWEDFATDAAIVALGRRTVEVDSVGSVADGYYDGGMIKLDRALVHIERQIGTVLTVFNELPASFAVSSAVKLLAGDDKRASTCRNKFDNLRRFLGFPRLPAKNPLLVRDGAPPPVVQPFDEPYNPVGYTTPEKFGWWDGDSITIDGDGCVASWDDKTGNSGAWTTGGTRPDAIPPGGDEQGVILFGQHLIGLTDLPDIGVPANTPLYGPDLSALAATGAEIFINIRLPGPGPSRLAIDGDKYRGLWWMAGPGYGNTGDVFPMLDGTIRSNWGLPFGWVYTFGPPRADLTQECAYNLTSGLDRWTARLSGNVLFTRAKSYDGHSASFSGGSVLGSSPGGSLLGTGDIERWLYGAVRRMIIYAGVLSPDDRAATLTYMQTGVGSPP